MKRRKSMRSTLSVKGEFTSTPAPQKSSGYADYGPESNLTSASQGRPKFICAICKKSFSDKNCLKKHIQRIHDIEPGPLLENNENSKNRVAPFRCRVCETEFAYKRNLKRHLLKYHSQGLEDEEGGNCFCNVHGCKFRSFFINALRTHLTEVHQVHIDVDNKTFSSRKDFDQWKEEEEKTNLCLFIKEAGKHTLINGDQRLIYQCHRSGHYSGHGFGKRSFRVKGTCKLGKRCTAGIELTVKEKGDVHEVVYYKTHIWHEPDVTHVNLSASERMYLANKLKEGASIASILESVKADKSVEGTSLCKRIHLLKRKDLVNIENTFHLNNTERHLKKQHKKGQKIDFAKIRKNIDDRGEIVSWILDSPVNEYEYFTVKKLQMQKCVENCGIVCVPCDACLHMYSCTCHDYLLFGTMCQHIHSVSSSLCPVQTRRYVRQSPKQFSHTFGADGDRVDINNSSSNSYSSNNNINTVTSANILTTTDAITISTPAVGKTSICIANTPVTNVATIVTATVPRVSVVSAARRKRRPRDGIEAKPIVDTITTVSDNLGGDDSAVNFLTKNSQNQSARELQLERNKLKEKIVIFKHLCEPRIDEMDENSLQLLTKIINSAMEIVNECSSIKNEMISNNAQRHVMLQSEAHIVQTTNPISMYHNHHHHHLEQQQQQQQQQLDGILHNPETVPKQMTNTNTMSTVPVPLQVLSSVADRKYEVSSEFYSTTTTAMTSTSPTITRKKRKPDDLPPALPMFRSPTTVATVVAAVDKRPIYEINCNDHSLMPDNYTTTFDCGLSWQTSTLSAANSSVVGKWWT